MLFRSSSGPTTGGTPVAITGTGFVTGSTVKFGTLTSGTVTVNSPTSITVVSPATINPGTVSVVVTTPGGDSTPAGIQGAAADDFTYTTVTPAVTALSPTSGTTAGGTTVTLTGTGFISGATVSFGGAAGSNVVVGSSTSITVTSPATVTPGAIDIRVTTAGGTSANTAADDYTYAAPVPTATSV